MIGYLTAALVQWMLSVSVAAAQAERFRRRRFLASPPVAWGEELVVQVEGAEELQAFQLAVAALVCDKD
jgi:hypothetical protein